MSRHGKRKQKNKIIIILLLVIIVCIIGTTYILQMQKEANDPGFGKIYEIENNDAIDE